MKRQKRLQTQNNIQILKAVMIFMLIFLIVLCTACGTANTVETAAEAETNTGSEDETIDLMELYSAPEESEQDQASQGLVTTNTFIDEPFYDGKITDEDTALEAVYSILDQIGGDETTELTFYDITMNEEDTIFYSFEQYSGDVRVYGGNAKLIADKDGNAIGLISSIITGFDPDPSAELAISPEEAEAIVKETYPDDDIKLYPDATEETLLSDPVDNVMRYVWVVYSNNILEDVNRSYLAHYVSESGEYLYALPVAEPRNEEALSGAVSVFAFEGFEEGEWTGTVKDIDGPERTITVPIMIDPETGTQYLGDPQRRILCADWSDFNKNDTLTPVISNDGNWINNELITYEMFIRVWDFYDNIGWHGPDGRGTPTLILMNLLDENGEPMDNASYSGKRQGFQTFEINDTFGDGSCSDIIGHEFTHCVTNASMIENIYENDSGAINEGISDIMGNLIEMSFEDSPGGEWTFAERHSNGIERSMIEPNKYGQPAYVWDQFYRPNTLTPCQDNDLGGVHSNASLIADLSYRLYEAGMDTDDQIYYWMNVILSISPSTDYPLLSQLLPWCMKMAGYPEYVDALNKAIEEEDLDRWEPPTGAENGKSLIKLELPFDPVEKGLLIQLLINPFDDSFDYSDSYNSYENNVNMLFPEGDYLIRVFATQLQDPTEYVSLALSENGWEPSSFKANEFFESFDPADQEHYKIHVDKDSVFNLPTDNLEELLTSSDS